MKKILLVFLMIIMNTILLPHCVFADDLNPNPIFDPTADYNSDRGADHVRNAIWRAQDAKTPEEQAKAEEVDRKALAMNLPPEQVSQITGLSKGRVLELQEKE